jgi:diguanylate cyclase (GGDEF)-like protein/PAS domain S-box-containing protein
MNKFLGSDVVWRRFLGNLNEYAFVLLDETGNVAAWSEGARALKLYSAEEIIGTHFSIFCTPEEKAAGHPEQELAAAVSAGRHVEEGWRVRRDGSRFWAHIVIRAIYDDHHVLCGFGKVLRDCTEQKLKLEQSVSLIKRLEQTARTDYLTGVDNRRSLDHTLAASISAARRHGETLSLAMIDLDRFKTFNDEFGHQEGDSYLRQTVAKWREVLRLEDFIARYGGEEFVVLLPATGLDAAVHCLERLRAMTPAPLTCSVGLAVWDGSETPAALLGRADRAVYRAKATGRDRLIIAGPAPALDQERIERRSVA